MKSGLEGRNNRREVRAGPNQGEVSMKSGLEGRNNPNEDAGFIIDTNVSMKSGLEGRNNWQAPIWIKAVKESQ